MRAEFDMSEVIQALENIGEHARDCSPQFLVIAADLVHGVTENFDTAGHGSFEPLKASTIRAKARKGKSAQPLLFNGGWRNSHEPDWGPDFAMTASDRTYGLFHTSKKARSKIPLRDPYAFDQEFWNEQVKKLGIFIVTGQVQ